MIGAADFGPRLQQLTGKTVLNEWVCGERSRARAARRPLLRVF